MGRNTPTFLSTDSLQKLSREANFRFTLDEHSAPNMRLVGPKSSKHDSYGNALTAQLNKQLQNR